MLIGVNNLDKVTEVNQKKTTKNKKKQSKNTVRKISRLLILLFHLLTSKL